MSVYLALVAVGLLGSVLGALSFHLGARYGGIQGYWRGYEAGSSDTFRTLAKSVMRWDAARAPVKPH